MAEMFLAVVLSICPCLEHIVCPHTRAVKHHGPKMVIDEDTVIHLDGEEISLDEFMDLDPESIEVVRKKVHRGHVVLLELETVEREIDWV